MADIVGYQEFKFRRCMRDIEEILSRPFNPASFRQLMLNHSDVYSVIPADAENDARYCTDDELLQQYNVLKNC